MSVWLNRAAFCLWTGCLLWELPSHIPRWFYTFHSQSIELGWMGFWFVLGGFLVWILPKLEETKQILLLFLGAWLMPIILSFSGEISLLDFCVFSGHAEFIRTGSRGLSLDFLLRNYESLMLLDHQRFAASKPPGQVLLYSALNQLAPTIQAEIPNGFVDAAHWRLSILLMTILPLMAALLSIPMFLLAKMWKIEKPWFPVFLLIVSAPFSLIVMHMDQALYPLLAVTILYCLQRAKEQQNALWAGGAGILWALACFVSFSLLPVLVLAFLIFPLNRQTLPLIGYALLGTIAVYASLYGGWGYDPILRYQNAMAHHAQWKGIVMTNDILWQSTQLNIAEFLLWMGPLAILFCGKIRRRDLIVFTALFGGLLVAGKTAGEVARLWLFLMPIYWMVSAKDEGNIRREYALLMMVWTALFKWKIDFWV